eukprot:147070_1
MASSRRALFVDCTGIIKRYQYFYTPEKSRYYSFDRFCEVLIASIIHTQPSVIYTTASPDINYSWRRELYPLYQARFTSSPTYPIYLLNSKLLDQLHHLLPINHIECPSQKNESGDVISSIIHQYTAADDQIFVLAQNKRFQQFLSLQRNINCIKTVRKPITLDDDMDDDELSFMLETRCNNQCEQIIDYLSLVDAVPGIGPVRAKQLLQFGNVPFLLGNLNETWTVLHPLQARLIEEHSATLKLFYEKLIPFDSEVQLDANVMNNAKTIDGQLLKDPVALLRLIQPLAEKYQLKSVLWRLREHNWSKTHV